jgi:hypothetical protein
MSSISYHPTARGSAGEEVKYGTQAVQNGLLSVSHTESLRKNIGSDTIVTSAEDVPQ